VRTLQIIQTKFDAPKLGGPAYRPAQASPTEEAVAGSLREHLGLCQEILGLVEKESQLLRQDDAEELKTLSAQRKSLLPRLNQSLDHLKVQRARWQQMGSSERGRHPEIGGLLRQNQDLIMKIIVLDRENEQTLLRKGMIPVQQLPAAQRQQAHFVTELYRRQNAKA
jgi:hypothetical protein